MQRIRSCIGITPCEQSSEAISLLLNKRLKFTAPGYSSFPSPCCRTSCSQKCGDKTRRLVGFAAQQFPDASKVWRSSLVRWRGGTGLAHLPGVTQDSSLEPSAAESSCGKIDNVQTASTSTPWLDTPGTHVFLDMALSFQFLKVKLLGDYSSGLYATPYPQGDEGLHFGTADSGNTYRDSRWDISHLRLPPHDLLFSWEEICQGTTWMHIVK